MVRDLSGLFDHILLLFIERSTIILLLIFGYNILLMKKMLKFFSSENSDIINKI